MGTEELIETRKTTHGEYATKAYTIQTFKRIARTSPSFSEMAGHEIESLDNIFQKIGRILYGDPHFKDHWDDIAGYATLTSKELNDERTN